MNPIADCKSSFGTVALLACLALAIYMYIYMYWYYFDTRVPKYLTLILFILL